METAADATELRPSPPQQPPRTRHRGVLRYPVVRQLARFAGVGVVCTASSLAIYALLRPWIDPQLANAVALIVTSLMNTALNRRLTFKITGKNKRTRDHLSGVIVIAIALVITGGSLGVLHLIRPEATVTEELWTTTLSGFVATAVRFTLLRHWIFRRARHV
ncbi:GtrA family protein [Paenarthrobacter sp. OM7]|uniref:GtrA family protein n=1 Tax=Paenarthrobacter sp. OM7 TaxID=3041264 RepID=UPI00246901E1|nr:GtrA family protein [Paenarthrobacter sp. OM7]WGM18944.1 GtrA family protein [Paenarthrobacter sp. OM7]